MRGLTKLHYKSSCAVVPYYGIIHLMKNDQYYTYLYRDIDGTPIYVGKGKGRRAWKHWQGRGNKRLLNTLLKRLETHGVRLEPEIQYHVSEETAFATEINLIKFYGRADLKTGTLYNLTGGGEGTSGHIATQAQKDAISRANKGRPKTQSQIEASIKNGLASKGRKLGPTSQAQKDAVSKAQKGRKQVPATHAQKAAVSLAHKGKVNAFNLTTLKTEQVSKEEFDANKGILYVGVASKLATQNAPRRIV